MFAKSLAFILSLALPLLLVRRLSQTEFGSYKQAFLVIGTAVAILPFGFGTSAFYFLPREDDPKTKNQIIFNILLFNLVVGLAAFIALWSSPGLFSGLFHDSKLVGLEALIGSVILFWLFSSFLETIAVANQEAKVSTVFILGAQFSKALLLLSAAVFFGTVWSLVVAALIHAIIQTAVLLWYLQVRFKGFWFSFSWPVLRTQLSYVLPYSITALLFTAQTDLHNYFVAHRYNAATFAIYSIGCMQLPMIGILSESLASVMIPRLSILQKENNRREIVRLMTQVMRKLAFVHFPLYAFLMVSGKEFIRWLFTDAYAGSWPIFAVNLTWIPFYVIMLDPIVRAYAEQRYFLLKLRLILFALLVPGLWFAVGKFGPIGAIAVVVSTNLIEHVLVTVRSAKIIGFERRDIHLLSDLSKLAMAAAVGACGALMVKPFVGSFKPLYVLAISGGVFILLYVSAVLLLKIPTADERQDLLGKIGGFERFMFWRRTPTRVAES
jgi:O-antigen/teichoic acid export membrane protein